MPRIASIVRRHQENVLKGTGCHIVACQNTRSQLRPYVLSKYCRANLQASIPIKHSHRLATTYEPRASSYALSDTHGPWRGKARTHQRRGLHLMDCSKYSPRCTVLVPFTPNVDGPRCRTDTCPSTCHSWMRQLISDAVDRLRVPGLQLPCPSMRQRIHCSTSCRRARARHPGCTYAGSAVTSMQPRLHMRKARSSSHAFRSLVFRARSHKSQHRHTDTDTSTH